MKQLSQDAIEALPIIKPFAISGDTRLSQEQFLAMKCVYENIDLVFNNRKTTVNPGCSGCIPTCLKIIANYLKMMGEFHDKPTRKVEAKVERVEVVPKIEDPRVKLPEVDPEKIERYTNPPKKKSNGKRKRK